MMVDLIWDPGWAGLIYQQQSSRSSQQHAQQIKPDEAAAEHQQHQIRDDLERKIILAT